MQILITGCAGSLGKAFVEYLHEDHHIIGVDNSEWAVAEMVKDYPTVDIRLGDFTDWQYSQDPVDLVIHCAAYKHLPLGEKNVNSFIENNINKTRKLFYEAYTHNADILFISTDKAVEPCNLYGYTKAIGEYIARQYDGYVVRCGNLMNSSGSVIAVWEKALKENRPLPVTDLNMKRFVIDVDDAVQQIWQGYEAKHKLIIPECKLVSLAGMVRTILQINNKPSDYPLEIIGIREGEKLEEKLTWPNEERSCSPVERDSLVSI